MNPYEERARARKTSAILVTALRSDLDLIDLALLDRNEWAELAERAGVRPPSDLSRRIVLENLHHRQRGRIDRPAPRGSHGPRTRPPSQHPSAMHTHVAAKLRDFSEVLTDA